MGQLKIPGLDRAMRRHLAALGTFVPEDNGLEDSEAGGITAEYAIAILTAAGFAGLLLAILQSDAVRGWLLAIVQRALN
ncbi:MAG: DUF4244 domain-containing protein [Bifidobacteriaceae bacterium]|jgi:hypothetical protein|nr:DUF4244 domain-containing protein [Bifidobacteriaceae bacterium]